MWPDMSFRLVIFSLLISLFSESKGQLAKEKQESSVYMSNTDTISSLVVSEGFNPAVLAIEGWQKISFNTPLLNCPFIPCCSNYGIQSFRNKDFFTGILYTADRISRCHPFAEYYYQKNRGQLLDPLEAKPYFSSEHVPWLAIPISFVLPGFNKMINGRAYDGLSMLLVTELSAYLSVKTYNSENYFFIPLSFIFISFYASDIYFNFLSLP